MRGIFEMVVSRLLLSSGDDDNGGVCFGYEAVGDMTL